MKKLLIFCGAFGALLCSSCGGTQSGLQEDGKRYVRSIVSEKTVCEFTYDNQNRMTEAKGRDQWNQPFSYRYTYDEGEISVTMNGAPAGKITYNEDGTSVTVLQGGDPDLQTMCEYRFSAEGQLQNILANRLVSNARCIWKNGDLMQIKDDWGTRYQYTDIETPATNLDLVNCIVNSPNFSVFHCVYPHWGMSLHLPSSYFYYAGSDGSTSTCSFEYELDERGYVARIYVKTHYDGPFEDTEDTLEEYLVSYWN